MKIVLLIMAGVCACAAESPRTLISESEAEPIRSAIVRKEAWTIDPVRRLRSEAERHMKDGPWSVTADRPENVRIDPHDYYSVAAYWWPNPDNPGGPFIRRDAVNPDRFLSNKSAMHAMSDAVFTLSAAGFLLDEPRYLQRARTVIRTWFIDSRTRMNPHLEYAQSIPGVNDGRGAGSLDGRPLIRAIQGMEFLDQSGGWDAKEQATVRRWFDEYLKWLTESNNAEEEKRAGNSNASWWTAQVAAVATFAGNSAASKVAFQHFREQIFPKQIRSDGSAPREEQRLRPQWSSVFNLEAMVTTCRIAQLQGVDLWQTRAQKDATIANVIEYLQPYLTDPHRWKKEQAAESSRDGAYFLALAGMGLKRPEYVSLFRKIERPGRAWTSVIDLAVSRWEGAAHQTRH